MNGMQQVNTWNLMDIIPVTAGGSNTYVPTEFGVVQF
jgi:hypothetical protein